MAKYVAMSFLPHRLVYEHEPLPEYAQYLIITAVARAQHVAHELPLVLLGAAREEDTVYARRAFNEFGDMQGHLGFGARLDTSRWDNRPRLAQRLNRASLERLREFVVASRSKGAIVAFTNPALYEGAYLRDSVNIAVTDSALRAVAGREGMLMLSTPRELLFAAEEMYDNIYHLNASGRTRRTALMIEKLRATGLNAR